MENPIEKIMNAKTVQEVDEIVLLNWEFFIAHPMLMQLAKTSKRRIRNLDRMIKESWKPLLN
jgi:hypothetical protein